MSRRRTFRQISGLGLPDDVSPTDFTKLRHLLPTFGPADLHRYTELLQSWGVTANRWTSPDLLSQLHQAGKRPIDLIVCNGLDCDDALPLQDAVVCEFAAEIVAAIAMLGSMTGAKKQLIALDSKGDGSCGRAIEQRTANTSVKPVSLRNRYPQQHPTLLLHTLAGRAVRPGQLPTESGAIVLDAIAAAAVGRCLLSGEPLSRTPVGIADLRDGAGGERVHFLTVPIGMSIADVLREAGIAAGAFELRGGSPLRQVILNSDDFAITPGNEAALYLVDPQPHVHPDPCIRCGWCALACPVHIQPAGILHAAQIADRAAAEEYGLDSCIECGICSYVCPSHLPLLAGIRSFPRTACDV